MPIPIICPCSAKLRAADHLKGQRIQCPRCKAVHDVVASGAGNGRHSTFTSDADPEEVLAKSGFTSTERSRLEGELEEGEKLLWARKAIARSVFLRFLLMSFGFYFLPIVLLVIVILAWSKMDVLNLILFGVIGGGVTVIAIVWPFFHRARAGNNAYAITNKRVLVWDRDWFLKPRFESYGPSDVAAAKRSATSTDPKAIGSIVFSTEKLMKVGQMQFYRVHGIQFVDDLVNIEKLIREALIDSYTDSLYR